MNGISNATEYLKSWGVPDDPNNHSLPLHKTRPEVDTELEERLQASITERDEVQERNRSLGAERDELQRQNQALEAERDQLRQRDQEREAEIRQLREHSQTLEIDLSSARKRCAMRLSVRMNELKLRDL